MTILDGNSYTFAIHFTGWLGELRYDSSNWDLLLHDGVTEGGHRFLNQTNADQRYQARSVELDGLLEFEPQQKGFLVRLGPSSYRIRTWTVDTANLVITNANGYNGNPKIGLKPTITSDHTWSGVNTFTDEIQAEGGIRGDLVGGVIGNVTGNLLGNSTGFHTGSIDTRGADFVVDDGQIHLAALNDDVADYILARGVPYGGIIMWSGSLAAIPDYWYLCDGTNGTPDLRDRFIMGAGGSAGVGITGGSSDLTADLTMEPLMSHTHTFTDDGHVLTLNESPAHFHGSGASDRAAPGGGTWNAHGLVAISGSPTSRSVQDREEDGISESKTTTVGGDQPHQHNGETDLGGSVTPVGQVTLDPRPPYFALAYIMKGV